MRVLFAGGGTGGHLFPAIAIAREVEKLDRNGRIEFVGTGYGIESKMRDKIGYPLSIVSMRGMPRKFSPALLIFPIRLIISILQALRICRRFKPDVVIGTGGYVSAPVIITAALKSIPRAMQEQNSFPGLVTRKLAKHVNVIFTAYHKAAEYLPRNAEIKLLGNPVRRSIIEGVRAEALAKFNLRSDRKTILILGGSQGARKINEAVLASLDYLDDQVQLLWQCGKRDYKDVAARLNKKDFVISLFPFLDNMELVYAAADLAVARAGAITLAELMACGIPAILIPFPYATADHQTYNATEIVKSGAAQMIADSDLGKINLMERAVALVKSDDLQTMKGAALELGRPEAATNIAREILQLAWKEGEQFDRQGTHGAG